VRKKGGKEANDLLPSIRIFGVLQPLLVRPNCEGFEIIAGQRRFHALGKLAEEGIAEPVPCIIMEDGDDAKAIEASLVENVARLPMDEIDKYKAFAALRGQGLDVAEIASRFGVTERLVDQRLAIAGIIEPILNAYRREEIGADTLRILTMATPKQQKAWWALRKSEDEYAPTGHHLKHWLLGGAQVPVSNALFDLAQYNGMIVSDLFAAERYFADGDQFWRLQNAAVAAKRDAYLNAGWCEVVILDIGKRFALWEHEKATKRKGGKVFIAISHDGEVSIHEGWLTWKEVKRLVKQEDGSASGAVSSARSELTSSLRNYLGLHKHAAVRTELLARPNIALLLAVAHIIVGSGLWTVKAEDQRANTDAIAQSLGAAPAAAAFTEERAAINRLFGWRWREEDDPFAVASCWRDLGDIFAKLRAMDDATVMRVLAYLMAETLQTQTDMTETLGSLFGTDMRNWWTPDGTFFSLLRDKEAINAMLRETAGDLTADAHVASTAKVQKKIVTDCLAGTNGRQKVDNWLPRYMSFPAQGYTARFAPPVMPANNECVPDEDGMEDEAA